MSYYTLIWMLEEPVRLRLRQFLFIRTVKCFPIWLRIFGEKNNWKHSRVSASNGSDRALFIIVAIIFIIIINTVIIILTGRLPSCDGQSDRGERGFRPVVPTAGSGHFGGHCRGDSPGTVEQMGYGIGLEKIDYHFIVVSKKDMVEG